jgi:hypothetical protein
MKSVSSVDRLADSLGFCVRNFQDVDLTLFWDPLWQCRESNSVKVLGSKFVLISERSLSIITLYMNFTEHQALKNVLAGQVSHVHSRGV